MTYCTKFPAVLRRMDFSHHTGRMRDVAMPGIHGTQRSRTHYSCVRSRPALPSYGAPVSCGGCSAFGGPRTSLNSRACCNLARDRSAARSACRRAAGRAICAAGPGVARLALRCIVGSSPMVASVIRPIASMCGCRGCAGACSSWRSAVRGGRRFCGRSIPSPPRSISCWSARQRRPRAPALAAFSCPPARSPSGRNP